MRELVRDLMSADPATCHSDDRATEPARLMWERDCGAVPVVDDAGCVVGMITDRDLCMAAYTRGARLEDIRVGDIMARTAVTCALDDTIESARSKMARAEVRRLPVVDDRGVVCGVLSINDLIRRHVGNDADAVVATLAAIGAPRLQDDGLAD
jgi:CBS domain-containing protein